MPATVGIVCNRVEAADGSIDLSADEVYALAVRDGAGALPLMIPSLERPLDPSALIAALDGFLFCGAVSNVEPQAFGSSLPPTPPRDPARDALALPLIRAAIAAGKPVLCICRGFQELNVALGGSLHQALHALPGRRDHREDARAPRDVQFAPAHEVTAVAGGRLERIVSARRFAVNSLHGQGIDALAPPLCAEAHAPDGTIEAVSMPTAEGFVVGVQWHPEWRWSDDSVSRALFGAFAEALAD